MIFSYMNSFVAMISWSKLQNHTSSDSRWVLPRVGGLSHVTGRRACHPERLGSRARPVVTGDNAAAAGPPGWRCVASWNRTGYQLAPFQCTGRRHALAAAVTVRPGSRALTSPGRGAWVAGIIVLSWGLQDLARPGRPSDEVEPAGKRGPGNLAKPSGERETRIILHYYLNRDRNSGSGYRLNGPTIER